MSTRNTPWPAGTPCWVDLATPDIAAATAFYGPLLGWEFVDTGAEMGNYHMCLRDGAPVAGMATPPADTGTPPGWTTYLASDDADASAEAITRAGGTLAFPAMTVADQGRMLVAVDPVGAMFGVWQHGEHIGMRRANEPGSVGWNQCMSADPDTARAFYRDVFGYTYTAMEGGMNYSTIDGAGPGNTIGGIGELPPGSPPGAPAWQAYFVVEDADAAAATIRAGGGTVRSGPDASPFGRMIDAIDPHGAAFSLAEVTSPAS